MKYYFSLGVATICMNINYRFAEDNKAYEEFVEFVKTSTYASKIITTLGPNNDHEAEGIHVNVVKTSALSQCDMDNDFIIPADSDEFHVYPDTLPNIMNMMKDKSIHFLHGCTYEKVGVDGSCPPILDDVDIFTQFPNINHNLFCMPKIGIVQARYAHLLGVGHHYIEAKHNLTSSRCVKTHHFRWNQQGKQRVENWIRLWTNPKCGGWKDIKKYETMLAVYNSNLLEYKKV